MSSEGSPDKVLPFTKEEANDLYYAGLFLQLTNETEMALRCFERIAFQFPPARIASIWLRFELGKTNQSEKELASFLADQKAMDEFGNGLRNVLINPDIPLIDYLQRYAYHDELRKATHFLSLRSRRLSYRIYDGAKLSFFFEIFTFDTAALNQLHQFFRTAYLKKFFQAYFDTKLKPLIRDSFTEENIATINEEVEKLPNSRAKEIYERLDNFPPEENRATATAGYFDAKELSPEQALLLNNYFFVNGHSSTYDKWMFDFYIIEKATRSGWKPDKPLESGLKGAGKKLLENPIGRVGEALAVLGSAVITGSVLGSILLGVGAKFTASFLVELLLQYLKSDKVTFNNYADFTDSFEVYIAEQRDLLGAKGFQKRFPLELLKG